MARKDLNRDLLELYRGLNLALDLHAQWWLDQEAKKNVV